MQLDSRYSIRRYKTTAHGSESSHQQFIFTAVTNLFMSVSIFVFFILENRTTVKVYALFPTTR